MVGAMTDDEGSDCEGETLAATERMKSEMPIGNG